MRANEISKETRKNDRITRFVQKVIYLFPSLFERRFPASYFTRVHTCQRVLLQFMNVITKILNFISQRIIKKLASPFLFLKRVLLSEFCRRTRLIRVIAAKSSRPRLAAVFRYCWQMRGFPTTTTSHVNSFTNMRAM